MQAYERFDTGRNMFLQYWPWGDQAMNMQNPYWVQYRNMRTNKRDRYMLNLNAKYQVNDWLDIAGRVRIDNTVGENEKSTGPARSSSSPARTAVTSPTNSMSSSSTAT